MIGDHDDLDLALIISNIMYLHSTYAVDWYHMYLHHQREIVYAKCDKDWCGAAQCWEHQYSNVCIGCNFQ